MQFAENDAFEAGRTLGHILATVITILGVLKCLSISRRKTTNSKCVWALTLVLGAFFVSSLRMYFPTGAGISPALSMVLTGLMSLVILGLVVASIILGIVGLAEYDPNQYAQGRAQAIWALSLNGLVLIAVGVGMVAAISKAAMTAQGIREQPAPGQLLTFKDLNFEFIAPGRPWVQVDANRLNQYAKVAFIRSNPEMYLIIMAEPGANPDYSTESLAALAEARIQSSADYSRIIHKVPARVGNLNGLEELTEARIRNISIDYVQWFCATNGWLYQVVFWGTHNEQDKLLAEARSVRESFRPIDYSARPLIKGRRVAADLISTNFGYAVRCAGSEWLNWANLDTECQFASYGALHPRDAAFSVTAVSLAGLPQEPDAIYRGLFGLWMTTDVLKQSHSIQEGQFEGVEASVTRPVASGKEFLYRMKVLRGGDFAYLISAWIHKDDPQAERILDDAMSRVDLTEKPQGPLDAATLTPRDKRVQRLALNGIGLVYFGEQRFDESAGFFKRAVDMDGLQTNTPYLQNLTEAYIRSGNYQTALDELEQHLAFVDSHPALAAQEAFLEGQLGQVDSAVAGYAKTFAGGYHSEEYFKDYIGLLAKAQQQEKAVSEVEAYLKREDSVEVRLLQAQLLVQLKKFDVAIPMLRTLREKYPFHAGIAYALGDALIQNGKASEALALSQEMLKASGSSLVGYTLKGRAQFALKWYREAKESFEIVTKAAPENRDARQFLEAISGILGEGSNATIQDPISPVPLPPELADAPTNSDPDFGKNEGAFYSRKITAMSFQKGRESKTTEILEAHILTAAGVSSFSTFQMPFNPLNEEVYVNQLVVRDSSGRLVSTGHVADYYVLDDRSAASASNQKVLNIPVAGLEPGDSLELMITSRELGQADEFTFRSCVFSSSFPVQERVVYYAGDTNLIRYASSPRLDPKPVSGGLVWREKNPALIRWEPLMPSVADYLHTLWLSDAGAAWPDLVTNYLGTIRDRLELSADQKELARQITAHATNLTEKIDAVASYVQTNYTYKAIEFGRRARVPQTISDIVRNKYGDCKDHSVLVQQLLESAGVPAKLALLNTAAPIREDLPSLDQFNHMVVYIPSAENRFLDCTAKGFDLSSGVFGLAGKDALILDEDKPRFEKVPAYPANASMIGISRSIELTNQTDVRVRETLTFHGVHAGIYRQYIRNLPLTSRRSFLANQFFGTSVEVEDFKVSGLDDVSDPLVLEFVYLERSQFHTVENELVGSAPVNFERGLLLDQDVEKRTTPFEIAVPLTVEASMEIHAPEGFRARPVSENAPGVDGQFVSGHFSARTNSAGWRMDYQFDEASGRFAPGEYPAYTRAMRQTLDMLAPRLVCVRTGK